MLKKHQYIPIKVTGEGVSAMDDLINFCDEFSEFNDYCAFFCDAVVLIASTNDQTDKQSNLGLERYAQSLKDRSHSLHAWIQLIQSEKRKARNNSASGGEGEG